MIDLKRKKVLVTGGGSMIGRAVCDILRLKDADVIQSFHRDNDLLFDDEVSKIFFDNRGIEYVVHLATYSGNIQFNQKYPADTFYRTAIMGLNVLNIACWFGVRKIVSILSSCAIADTGADVLTEDMLWQGLPNETIECHGLAKRMLHAYSRQISRQYDVNAVCCIVNNSFGPYDSYDLNKTKVIGGLIKRFVDARNTNLPEVTCWGTGAPLREFVYCKDAAEGIVQVLEKYDDSISPINITSGQEISIKDLAETIAELVGYKGQVLWDTSKGDGQMRKKLDDTKMKQHLDIKFTSFKDALKETIEWYEQNWDCR